MIVQCRETWTLGAQLGAGDFGRVFEATSSSGRAAAVKLIPKAPGASRELLFVELEDVQNVVPVLDSGETENAWVIVMPLAERSLADQIAQTGAVAVDAAIPVLLDVATALVDLEARGIVHRDVKSDNVLLLRQCPTTQRSLVLG